MAQRMTYIDQKRAEEEAKKQMSLADLIKTGKKGYDLYNDIDEATSLGNLASAAPSSMASTAGGEIVGSAVASDMGPGYLLSSGAKVPAPTTGVATTGVGAVTPLSQIMGGAGVAAGAYGAYQGIKDKNPVMAGLGGGGIGLGLTQLGYAIPGWGWAAAIAAPVALSLINKWSDKDAWKNEQEELGKLQGPAWQAYAAQQPKLSGGRSRSQLVDIENKKAEQGLYSNSKYAQTRQMSDSKPEDWWGYSAWGKKFGDDWLTKLTEDQRRSTVQKYMDVGGLKDKGGSLSVTDNAGIDAEVMALLNGKPEEKSPSQNGFYKPINQNGFYKPLKNL